VARAIGVVGAGIIGLAVARRLQAEGASATVTVLEKEDAVARHQSGHNSGVAHAGLYYAPGSLKAQLCRRGIGLLKEYCQERGIAYEECGKLVIARSDTEVPRLEAIEARASANGVPGLRRVPGAEIAEIEPNAQGVLALHSPHTAIVDFPAVAAAFAADVAAAGGEVRLHFEVAGIEQRGGGVRVRSRGGEDLLFDELILCAGVYSDRLARLAGDVRGPAIVPFRGEYYELVEGRRDLVRGLIYPVPDPAYPFLGVHFTRRVDGGVDIGPNAVLALAREGYAWRNVSARDTLETLRWVGFPRLARRHWRMGLREMRGSLLRGAFIAEARSFVPALSGADVRRAGAGVRAQALDADGSLVDDFRINRLGSVVAVRNAPSPGATSSLAIAEHIASQVRSGVRAVQA
jgi:(S)-2-hydroxyglutarate dehydrogenase